MPSIQDICAIVKGDECAYSPGLDIFLHQGDTILLHYATANDWITVSPSADDYRCNKSLSKNVINELIKLDNRNTKMHKEAHKLERPMHRLKLK